MNDWLVYLVGYPGSGKTTAMSIALEGVPWETEQKPFAHTVYGNGLVELGYDREPYGGTDSLALNIQPVVVKWMSEIDVPVVVAEGDRLANHKFFGAATGTSNLRKRKLCLVHLKCPELTARKRAWERGSRFNESWLKGRISKVDNLIAAAKSPLLDGNGHEIPANLDKNVFGFIDGQYREIDGTLQPDAIGSILEEIIEGLNG